MPGRPLWSGQMCTSGARLQLAIAPAGAGKTTAMRALALAWTEDGGQVVGLAPSAAAAAVLREHTGASAPTRSPNSPGPCMHGDLPDWAQRIGRSSLVIIDEAGMADTLSLDTAVQFVIGRGGSVRLVGDDQQLAAIGAGGVLRDIQAHPRRPPPHRAAPVHRPGRSCRHPSPCAKAEPEALGFYLDTATHPRRRPRQHHSTVPSPPGQNDRSHGLDAIMLAPTRELVAASTTAPATIASPTPPRAARSS